jgi:esterase/lipase superfamily enzyme
MTIATRCMAAVCGAVVSPGSAPSPSGERWRLAARLVLIASVWLFLVLARPIEAGPPTAGNSTVVRPINIDRDDETFFVHAREELDFPSPDDGASDQDLLPDEELEAIDSPEVPPADGSLCPSDLLADVWVISTRGLHGGCQATDAAAMRYFRKQGPHWVESDLAEFSSTNQPWRPIVIWIHGNNTSPQDARANGWQVYRLISRARPQPIRFVIWSWPSTRASSSVVRDLRMKASISDAQGYYLAWFLRQVRQDTPIVLIGYSYGTRLISSGLHLLAGGAVRGRRLSAEPLSDGAATRTLLIAAAQDSQSFLPWGPYSLAGTQTSELKVFYNPCDFVLRWYPRLEKIKGPPALGATGLSNPWQMGLDPSQVGQVNVKPYVGMHHRLQYYLESPAIIARMQNFVYTAGPPLLSRNSLQQPARMLTE